MSSRTSIIQALQGLAGNSCTGNCDQGRACTCGSRPTWATTSDPMAWVQIDPPAPQNARRIPRASPPWRLRDWLIAAVVVAAVLCAQALADMPTSVLMQGLT